MEDKELDEAIKWFLWRLRKCRTYEEAKALIIELAKGLVELARQKEGQK